MKVIVTTPVGDMFNMEVSDDMDLESFRAVCAMETGLDGNQVVLKHEGKELTGDNFPLSHFKIKDNDVLAIEPKATASTSAFGQLPIPNIPSSAPSSAATASPFSSSALQNEALALRNEYLNNPSKLAVLRHNSPELAAALESGLEPFMKYLDEKRRSKIMAEQERVRRIMANPFDAEAQKLIAEEIQRQNIESNMEAAMEYHPESFGQVTMLYINCKVNGHPVKAFIDSGAQATIMSKRCAEVCGITRLIDNRWAGIAKGVGVQRITGRIHLCQLQIENDFLPSSFTILEEQEMDMLLGLDMLRRHQCCIDLKKNVLLIGTTGTETTFLGESEIPKHLRDFSDKGSEKGSLNEDSQLNEAINRSILDSQGPSSSTKKYTESSVQELINMGFKRDEIIRELINYNDNKERALAALLAQSLKMPPN